MATRSAPCFFWAWRAAIAGALFEKAEAHRRHLLGVMAREGERQQRHCRRASRTRRRTALTAAPTARSDASPLFGLTRGCRASTRTDALVGYGGHHLVEMRFGMGEQQDARGPRQRARAGRADRSGLPTAPSRWRAAGRVARDGRAASDVRGKADANRGVVTMITPIGSIRLLGHGGGLPSTSDAASTYRSRISRSRRSSMPNPSRPT